MTWDAATPEVAVNERVHSVQIPTVQFKASDETDAKLYRDAAFNISRGKQPPQNVRVAIGELLESAAQALKDSGAVDPESSYYANTVKRGDREMRLEWTDRAGEVCGHVVYVFYNDGLERALYVGKTVDLVGRLAAHRSGPDRKKWFPDINRVVITPCDGPNAASKLERETINELNPIHNVQRFEVA